MLTLADAIEALTQSRPEMVELVITAAFPHSLRGDVPAAMSQSLAA